MDYFTRMVVESNMEYMIDEQLNGGISDVIVITDSFGFVEKTIENGQSLHIPEALEGEQQERLTQRALKLMKTENSRVFKWKEMLEDYPEKPNKKLKSRARKGIPDAIRGYAWTILIQGSKHLGASVGASSGEEGKDKAAIFKGLMEEQGD